jgi:hypothetical protein
MKEIAKDQVVNLLNRILESELAGVIRYTTIRSSCSAITAFRLCRGCESRLLNP